MKYKVKTVKQLEILLAKYSDYNWYEGTEELGDGVMKYLAYSLTKVDKHNMLNKNISVEPRNIELKPKKENIIIDGRTFILNKFKL